VSRAIVAAEANLPTALPEGAISNLYVDERGRLHVTGGGGGGGAGGTVDQGNAGSPAAAWYVRQREPLAPAEYLALDVLPAAGAWTSQPPYNIPPGIRRLRFFVAYQGATLTSGVQYRLRWGDGTALYSEQVVDSAIATSGFQGFQTSYDLVIRRPTTETEESRFVVEVEVEGGATQVVLELAEYGDVSDPGMAGIMVAGSY
jgi:hypothetical protein